MNGCIFFQHILKMKRKNKSLGFIRVPESKKGIFDEGVQVFFYFEYKLLFHSRRHFYPQFQLTTNVNMFLLQCNISIY